MKALMVDILCLGTKTADKPDTPFQIELRILDDSTREIETVSRKTFNINVTETVPYSTMFSLNKYEFSNEGGQDIVGCLCQVHDIISKCKERGFYLIGFNHVSYDMEILNENFTKYLEGERFNDSPKTITFDKDKIIDVMTLAGLTYDKKIIGSVSMGACFTYISYEKSDISSVENWKNNEKTCEGDNDVTLEIYKDCLRRDNLTDFKSVSDFIYSPRKYETFPFGKYKDFKISDVFHKDYGYVKWLMTYDKANLNYPGLIESIKDVISSDVD